MKLLINIIPRNQTGLPMYPADYYPGPYSKIGVCLHNMAVGDGKTVSLEKAKQVTKGNYNYHLSRWNAIDIIEGYDLYDVNGIPTVLECRPFWSTCDAFAGAGKLGYQWIGIEVYGNYDLYQPSAVILEGIVEFLIMCYNTRKISQLQMKGHRDFNPGQTSCPGNNLYPKIPWIVSEAKRRIEEGETTMLPNPIDKKHVFPDIWQDKYNYWVHFKDESNKVNDYRIIVTQGKKWLEIGKIQQTVPYERSSLDLKALLQSKNIQGSCAVTVLSTYASCVYIREFE